MQKHIELKRLGLKGVFCYLNANCSPFEWRKIRIREEDSRH